MKLKVQFCTQQKRFKECAQNLIFHVGGAKASLYNCGFAAAGSSCYKMWAGLNGFDPRTDFVLGGVRIGIDCMNLVILVLLLVLLLLFQGIRWYPHAAYSTGVVSSDWFTLAFNSAY